MKLPTLLAFSGALFLASCSKKDVVNVDDAMPAIEEPESVSPPAPAPVPAPAPPSYPASYSPFRTPAVTNSLVDERDLLPSASNPGDSSPPTVDESGAVIARPPASAGNE